MEGAAAIEGAPEDFERRAAARLVKLEEDGGAGFAAVPEAAGAEEALLALSTARLPQERSADPTRAAPVTSCAAVTPSPALAPPPAPELPPY